MQWTVEVSSPGMWNEPPVLLLLLLSGPPTTAFRVHLPSLCPWALRTSSMSTHKPWLKPSIQNVCSGKKWELPHLAH